nr:hypothetical protein [Tanacetum cinerariifolium]
MNNAIEDEMKESHNEILNMVKLFCEHILRQREQAANLSINITEPSRRLNSFCYDDDDDDDEERTIPLRNKELNTIPEKESNEFIKSSVEDLVSILTVTFSNPLFNSNDGFTSSDDESLSDEDVSEENVKIYSNPLFEFDDEYISSDVNSLFNEVLENIECKDSYDSNLDESTFLVTPLSDSNKDEYFTPGDYVELLLHRDPSTPIMSFVSILEGFINEPPLEENDDLFDLESKKNEWKKILYDTPINDLMTEDKVFNPGIHDQFFSPTYNGLLVVSGSGPAVTSNWAVCCTMNPPVLSPIPPEGVKVPGPFNRENCRRCTNVSFKDELVRNLDPISNDETPDFSYPPSQPQTSSLDQFHCFWCGDPLEDRVRYQRCTCKWCGNGLSKGLCFFCVSRDEISSINVPNPNSFNDTSNIFTQPPQPQYETYSCELCGNDSHYGYDYPPRFPLVYEQEPSYNQNFGDNYFSQNSPSFPQQYLCCDNCGGPHESFQCQPMNQNFYDPNPSDSSNYSGFDQPPQYSINHQP